MFHEHTPIVMVDLNTLQCTPPPLSKRTLRLLGRQSGQDLLSLQANTSAIQLDTVYVGFFVFGCDYLMLFHVFEGFRGMGIGTRVVQKLQRMHPNMWFFSTPSAYRFWLKLKFATRSGKGPTGNSCVKMFNQIKA